MVASRYALSPTEEALRHLIPLDLPGRDPDLPRLYKYNGAHPKRRTEPDDGNSYIYFIDSSLKGKALARELADKTDVPYGRLDTMKAMHPGEYRIPRMRDSTLTLESTRPCRAQGRRLAYCSRHHKRRKP